MGTTRKFSLSSGPMSFYLMNYFGQKQTYPADSHICTQKVGNIICVNNFRYGDGANIYFHI
jgi:hypothetical protein